MMPKEPTNSVSLLAVLFIIGITAGYFIGNGSSTSSKQQVSLSKSDEHSLDRHPRPVGFGKRTGLARFSGLSTTSWPPSELFARLGITQEEWEITQALNKRRDEGEYILKCERPTTKKLLDYDFNLIVSQNAATNSEAYDRIFSEFEIQPQTGEQLKAHLGKIHRASLEAEVAIQQLLEARQNYDVRVRAILSSEDYSRYRQYEEEIHPARHERDLLRDFLQKRNLSVDPQHEETLVGLIQDARSFTDLKWNGPYDGLPRPVIGDENVVKHLEERVKEITIKANDVLRRVSEAGLPSEYARLLENYYLDRIQQKETVIRDLRRNLTSGPRLSDGATRNRASNP